MRSVLFQFINFHEIIALLVVDRDLLYLCFLVFISCQYTIEASFLEIYNETIRDLLGSGDSNTKHEIKIVNPGNTGGACEVTVTNVKTVTVTSETQVSNLL